MGPPFGFSSPSKSGRRWPRSTHKIINLVKFRKPYINISFWTLVRASLSRNILFVYIECFERSLYMRASNSFLEIEEMCRFNFRRIKFLVITTIFCADVNTMDKYQVKKFHTLYDPNNKSYKFKNISKSKTTTNPRILCKFSLTTFSCIVHPSVAKIFLDPMGKRPWYE